MHEEATDDSGRLPIIESADADNSDKDVSNKASGRKKKKSASRNEKVQSKTSTKENYGLMQPIDGEDGQLKGVKFITPRIISPIKPPKRKKKDKDKNNKYVLSSRYMNNAPIPKVPLT